LVSLRNCSFTYNGGMGGIVSGEVSLDDIVASNNGQGGLGVGGRVTVANVVVSNNGGTGLEVGGTIESVANVVASNNGGDGIDIASTVALTVSHAVSKHNSGSGFAFWVTDALFIRNIAAASNGEGVTVSRPVVSPAQVLVQDSVLISNAEDGLVIQGAGVVSVTNLVAKHNGGVGLTIGDGELNNVARAVAIANMTLSGNGGGLNLFILGPTAITNCTITHNQGVVVSASAVPLTFVHNVITDNNCNSNCSSGSALNLITNGGVVDNNIVERNAASTAVSIKQW